MTAVEFQCPACGQKLEAEGSQLSAKVRCQRCKHEFRPVETIDRDKPIPAVPVDDESAAPQRKAKSSKRQATLLMGSAGATAQTAAASEPDQPDAAAKPTAAVRSGGQGDTVLMGAPILEAGTTPPAKPEPEPEPPLEPVPPPEPEPKPEPEPPPEPEPEPKPEPKPEPEPPPEPEAPPAPEPEPEPAAESAPLPAAAPEPPPAPEPVPAPEAAPVAPAELAPPALSPPPPESVDDGAQRPRLRMSLGPQQPRRKRKTTTLLEVSGMAEQIIAATRRRMRVKIAMVFIASITPLLVLATALSSGAWRWLPGSLAFVGVCALLVWGGLWALPRLAVKLGPRQLPGQAWWWLAAGATLLATLAGLVTWGASEATTPLVSVGLPTPEPGTETKPGELESAVKVVVRQGHVKVGPGVLHIPGTFQSTSDGSFDLLLHFHGNTRLVEQSVAEAGLNALVHITNLGIESDPYEQHFAIPGSFAGMIERIEKRAQQLGLPGAKVRRIAVSSWSAGYGAVYRVLQKQENFDRIDALMMLDGLHLGYVDEKNKVVDERHLDPFVRYAEAAIGEKKLFIITHSEIRTHGYASCADTADILVAQVGATRRPLDAQKDSPPHVDFDEARRALPRTFDKWLTAKTAASKGELHVLGYTGQSPEDHMAHLVQMSVTVLPKLVERWQ